MNPRHLSLTALLGILLGLLFYPFTQLFNQPIQVQSVGETNVDIQQFLFIAAAIERAIEVLKRVVLSAILPGEEREILRRDTAFVVSLLAGVVVAFVLNLNMFVSLGATGALALAGIVVTGLVVGGGSNLVHQAFELWTQLTDLLGARIEVVQSEARVVSSTSVETTTSTQSASGETLEFPRIDTKFYAQSTPMHEPALYVEPDEASG